MTQRGYIAVAPNITSGGDVASASAFRQAMKNAKSPEHAKQIYTKQFGSYDPKVFNLIYNKVAGKTMEKTMEQLEAASKADIKKAKEVIRAEDEQVSPVHGNKIKKARQELIKKYGSQWKNIVEGFGTMTGSSKTSYQGLSEAPGKGDIASRAVGQEMTDQQRQLADMGRALMNSQFQYDDELGNKMADVGSELTRFDTPEGSKSMEDMLRKLKMSKEDLLKFMKKAKELVDQGAHEMGRDMESGEDEPEDEFAAQDAEWDTQSSKSKRTQTAVNQMEPEDDGEDPDVAAADDELGETSLDLGDIRSDYGVAEAVPVSTGIAWPAQSQEDEKDGGGMGNAPSGAGITTYAGSPNESILPGVESGHTEEVEEAMPVKVQIVPDSEQDPEPACGPSYEDSVLELMKLAGIPCGDQVTEYTREVQPEKGDNAGFGMVDPENPQELDPIVNEGTSENIAQKLKDMGASLDDEDGFIKHLFDLSQEMKLGRYIMNDPDFIPDVMQAFKGLDESSMMCTKCGQQPCVGGPACGTMGTDEPGPNNPFPADPKNGGYHRPDVNPYNGEEMPEGRAVTWTSGEKPDKEYLWAIHIDGEEEEETYHSLEQAKRVVTNRKKVAPYRKYSIKRMKRTGAYTHEPGCEGGDCDGQIDEVSKDLLQRYVKAADAAKNDANQRGRDALNRVDPETGEDDPDYDGDAAAAREYQRRDRGTDQALGKIHGWSRTRVPATVPEEEQTDEAIGDGFLSGNPSLADLLMQIDEMSAKLEEYKSTRKVDENGSKAESVQETESVEEGKWDYPDNIKGREKPYDDSYTPSGAENRKKRKEFRKAQKAKAHTARMRGEVEKSVQETVTNETIEMLRKLAGL
jgi:hypothetical protein